MKKMSTKSANKIFDDINNRWDEFLTVEYGEDKTPIKFFYNISMTDLENIIALVSGVCDPKETRCSTVRIEAVLARCIIEYFTDLPVPTMEITNSDGETETIDDYNVCFELVFGESGLCNLSDQISETVYNLEAEICNAISIAEEYNSPVNRLAARILELGKEFAMAIDNELSNPDSALNQQLASLAEDFKGSVS